MLYAQSIQRPMLYAQSIQRPMLYAQSIQRPMLYAQSIQRPMLYAQSILQCCMHSLYFMLYAQSILGSKQWCLLDVPGYSRQQGTSMFCCADGISSRGTVCMCVCVHVCVRVCVRAGVHELLWNRAPGTMETHYYNSLHDKNAVFRGCNQVNVIHPSPSSTNQLQLCSGSNDFSRDLGTRPHHKTIILLREGDTIHYVTLLREGDTIHWTLEGDTIHWTLRHTAERRRHNTLDTRRRYNTLDTTSYS